MARIRTVKPDLWTDPDFVECSTNARLLFVAALNFASDYGVMADKPKRLKMQCFPADAIELEPLVDELVDAGFWQRRVAPDGAKVLVVRNFTVHQKVDKPNLGKWGDPRTWDNSPPPNSPTTSRIVAEPSSNGRRTVDAESPPEGKGREEERESLSVKGDSTGSPQALTDRPELRFLAKRTIATIAGSMTDAYKPEHPEAYWIRCAANIELQDGELIYRMLADGDPPDQVALFVLGHGKTSELPIDPRTVETVPWCTPACPTCDGDAWIANTDGDLVPCPNRTTPTQREAQ